MTNDEMIYRYPATALDEAINRCNILAADADPDEVEYVEVRSAFRDNGAPLFYLVGTDPQIDAELARRGWDVDESETVHMVIPEDVDVREESYWVAVENHAPEFAKI